MYPIIPLLVEIEEYTGNSASTEVSPLESIAVILTSLNSLLALYLPHLTFFNFRSSGAKVFPGCPPLMVGSLRGSKLSILDSRQQYGVGHQVKE